MVSASLMSINNTDLKQRLLSATGNKMVSLLIMSLLLGSQAEILTEKEHKTQAAVEKSNQLTCFICHTMEDGDSCANITGNATSPFNYTCGSDSTSCMVKRFSFTTSTENSTSIMKMWSLERNCTKKCEPGCIVIGERIKLYACTTCCETSFCNRGRGAGTSFHSFHHFPFVLFVVFLSVIVPYHVLLDPPFNIYSDSLVS